MNSETAIRRLGPSEFEQAFGESLSGYVRERIATYGFEYRAMNREERDTWLLKIIQTLLESSPIEAGLHRRPAWETGWGENLARFRESPVIESLIPGYFEKYPVIRWMQDFIHPLSPRFEYNSLALIQDWLFDRYLRDAETVYEFGCGTGHNLFRVRDVNPSARLIGLDWASPSREILEGIRRSGLDPNMAGAMFNLFEPDSAFALAAGACVVTVASLEQTGRQFKPFMDYLLSQPVRLAIHIEPIAEFLTSGHLLDKLSLAYFKARNYLDGFYDCLSELERAGRLKILQAQRSHIGSLYIDGYSVIVWSPVRATATLDGYR